MIRLCFTAAVAMVMLVSTEALTWPVIYSGQHFREVASMSRGSDVAAMSLVLVLYGPQCERQGVAGLGPGLEDIPARFAYFRHDYVSAREHTWYGYTDEDDLFKKYAPANAPCLTAYYFMKGSSLSRPSAVWAGETRLKLWAWGLLKKRVTVFNKSPHIVAVVVEKNTPGGFTVDSYRFLASKQSVVIDTYVSYMLKVTYVNYETTYYAEVIDETFYPELTFWDLHAEADSYKVWRAEVKLNSKWEAHIWQHAFRHMTVLKQPLLVHNVTEAGYRKTLVLPMFHGRLRKYYTTHARKRARDITGADDPDGVPPSLQQYKQLLITSDNLAEAVDSLVLPVLDDWCGGGARLRVTNITELYMHKPGSIFPMQVTTLNTHAVAAIIQVDGDGVWELVDPRTPEARRRLTLKTGEMLLLESARVMHGWQEPLFGQSVFFVVYAVPTVNWDYSADFNTWRYYSAARGLDDDITDVYHLAERRMPRDEL